MHENQILLHYRLIKFTVEIKIIYSSYFSYMPRLWINTLVFSYFQPLIVKYDLAKERITVRKTIDGASHDDGRYIYNLKKNYDYMDFAVDEHGLWLIYTTKDSNNAIVAQLDPNTLEFIFMRNISFSHLDLGKFTPNVLKERHVINQIYQL
jgi:hypothetical protein